MAKYELTLRKDGQDISRYTVGGGEVLIGRSSKSDLVLPDSAISHEHARIRVEADRLFIEDLDSTNGIAVNGRRVRSSAVNVGDIVSLGKYTLLVEKRETQDFVLDTGCLLSFEAADEVVKKFVKSDSSDPLPVLYRAAQLLGVQGDLTALLESILDLIFEAVPAKRGFILSRFSEIEEPVVRAGRSGDRSDDLPMSKTMIDHVFNERTAVLTANAQDDPRFQSAESIFGHGVHGAMCVPMCAHDRLVGAIYVDTDDEVNAFTEEHLELLTAIGRVVGIAVENLRLTEERVERERLAAIGEAVAGIGHCMKNILTGLKASGEFIEMAESRGDWSWIREGWGTMQKALKRFERLVGDLLTYARKMELKFEATDLNALIEEVAESARPRARKRRIQISFEPEDLKRVEVDQHQMFRVLLNLLDNAIDACKSEGHVELACWQNPYGTYIQVKDDGVGIEAEILPKITQAFFTTKGHGGTGLGLACAYQIVEQHEGRITVESEPGEGATFTVFLPRKTVEVQVPADATVDLPEEHSA